MIPNHAQFVEAVTEHKKVRIQYYSEADSGVVDRVCAAVDYGPGSATGDGLHRYWVQECAEATPPRTLGLLPQQIVDLRVLGETFDPAALGLMAWPRSIPRIGGPSA